MKTITNISNITDSSGTTPIVIYSNAVQTIVPNERHSTPRICNRVVICDQCGNCWIINSCNSNFSNWQNNAFASSCNCCNNSHSCCGNNRRCHGCYNSCGYGCNDN